MNIIEYMYSIESKMNWCVYQYIHTYTHIYTYIYLFIHTCIHTCLFIHTYIHIYIYSKSTYYTYYTLKIGLTFLRRLPLSFWTPYHPSLPPLKYTIFLYFCLFISAFTLVFFSDSHRLAYICHYEEDMWAEISISIEMGEQINSE